MCNNLLYNMQILILIQHSEVESRRKELDDDLNSERNAMIACADRIKQLDKEIEVTFD